MAIAWNLSNVIPAWGRCSVTPLMKAWLMSMQTSATACGSPPWAVRSAAQQPCRQLFLMASRVEAAAKLLLQFGGMATAGLIVPQVVLERLGEDANLFGDEPDERGRWALPFPQQPPWITQGAEHQGKSETSMVEPLPSDQREIRRGQGVVPGATHDNTKVLVQGKS